MLDVPPLHLPIAHVFLTLIYMIHTDTGQSTDLTSDIKLEQANTKL